MSDLLKPEKCAICGCKLNKTLLTIEEPDRFELHVGVSKDNYRRQWRLCSCCGAASDVYEEKNLYLLKTLSTEYYEVDLKGQSINKRFSSILDIPKDKSDNYQRIERVLSFYHGWRKRIGLYSSTHSLLDIGSGTGVFPYGFYKSAIDLGDKWDIAAVENDPHACEHIDTLDNIELIKGEFSDKLISKKFTLCTLNKVLEHVEKPIEFLSKVKDVLDPKVGILYVEVPDLITTQRRPANDNILGALHYHLYDPASLSYALRAVGLMVIEASRIFEPSGKITTYAFAVNPEAIDMIDKVMERC